MIEAEVVTAMREHLEKQFPKVCSNCKHCYETFREYVANTTHVGPPMSYDVQLGQWNPLKPLGTITYSNCGCGNTLALSSHGMLLLRLWALLNWARIETQKRGQSPQELLTYLREEICKQVLAEPEADSP